MLFVFEVETNDPALPRWLLCNEHLETGTKVEIADGVTLEFKGITRRKALDVLDIAAFVIHVGSGVAASVIANWIVKSFRGRACGTGPQSFDSLSIFSRTTRSISP